MFFLKKKAPNTEKILKNIIKFTDGNTKALNKHKFTNLLYALRRADARFANDYYKNNNGKWVAYHNRGRPMKNMLVENIGYLNSSAYKNYLTNYKSDPRRFEFKVDNF